MIQRYDEVIHFIFSYMKIVSEINKRVERREIQNDTLKVHLINLHDGKGIIRNKKCRLFYRNVEKSNNIGKFVSIFLFMIFVCLSNINSQTKYLIKDAEGFDYILNVTINDNIINGFTREKTLLDYASKFNYRLTKLISPLKHPEIIRFNAILDNQNFEGTFDLLFSSYKIVGDLKQDSIHFSLFDKTDKLYKRFKGSQVNSIYRVKKDYEKLTEDVIKITEENIFNPQIIRSKKWKNFREKMKNAAPKIVDDLEFQIGFFALIRNFDFSHYYIVRNITTLSEINEIPSLNEIDKNTAILKISTFFEKIENIKPLLDTIVQKAYSNLIIDLRDNPGGNYESPSLIANFMTDKVFISGFFPNRKWYEEYNRQPNKNDIDKFNMIIGDSVQTNSEYGFYVSTKGTEKRFKGNIYFLVNNKTGSAAEALVIGAKEYGLAKIVGQKTAGLLLGVKGFKIDEDIMLFVPINDFISYNGYRVDKKGIEPDIKTKKGKELEQIINHVNRSN